MTPPASPERPPGERELSFPYHRTESQEFCLCNETLRNSSKLERNFL
jgi:hypothetical protein